MNYFQNCLTKYEDFVENSKVCEQKKNPDCRSSQKFNFKKPLMNVQFYISVAGTQTLQPLIP